MEVQLSHESSIDSGKGIRYKLLIVVGFLISLVVFYVHFALFLNMRHFAHFLSTLFLINAIGALIAALGILFNSRWGGWVLGIVMSGGAAVAKILMNTVPGFGHLLMGVPSSAKIPTSPTGHGSFPKGSVSGHAPHPGGIHSALPLFLNMKMLGTVSVMIELVFVALAVYALVAMRISRR